MKNQLGRIYGIREGVEDPGAAQEAIGELADIVDQYMSNGAGMNLGRELTGWFKANLDTIKAALGLDDGDEGGLRGEALDPAEDEFIAQEGGPGSGRKPGPALPPGPPVGGDPMAIGGSGDEVYGMDGGPEDDGPPPSPGASGLPSDVMKKLRDVIQSLESLVPDEDPAGDMPTLDDDDDDDDSDDAPPSPKKKDKEKKPPKSKDKPDDMGEARRRRR